jgi:hypothetical protein
VNDTSAASGGRGDTQFRHFVLTRFNVRNRYYTGDPEENWLLRRLDLFQRFTVPSFAAQSQKDFRWLVLIDSESPAWFREALDAIGRGLLEAVDVAGSFTAEVAADLVAERLDRPFVMTTRVDNDDAVAVDFIETIQRAFVPVDKQFINLVDGAQLAGSRVYRRPYTQNPFVTLAERAEDERPAGVFVTRHYEVGTYAPVVNIRSGHPMWLQVVHSGNVLNELVGLRTRARRVAPWFGCHLSDEDRLVEFSTDFARGAGRIGVRLAARPHRLVELGRALMARPARRLRPTRVTS